MVLYQFKCRLCNNEQESIFEASDYDNQVSDNGLLHHTKCEKCNKVSLYRHITRLPGVMGGTKGYVSFDRWMQMHPEQHRRKKAEVEKQMTDRRAKRLSKIDQQTPSNQPERRHKGYGKGQGETKLSLDD